MILDYRLMPFIHLSAQFRVSVRYRTKFHDFLFNRSAFCEREVAWPHDIDEGHGGEFCL